MAGRLLMTSRVGLMAAVVTSRMGVRRLAVAVLHGDPESNVSPIRQLPALTAPDA